MNKPSLSYISLWLPLLVGLLLLPVPLLGNFHIESALVAAATGCFWAGVIGCKDLSGSESDDERILFILCTLYLAGLPLLIFALFTGCFSLHGLGFWILYPIPSVLFGYALGRMLRLWQMPFCTAITVFILLIVAIGIPVIQFFNLPQVYFFNHVWGGWPGPIYDEIILVSASLLFFRMLTLLWTVLFWFIPNLGGSIKAKAVIAFCAGGLILGYAFLPRLGIISPRSYIQKQLDGVKETAHFIIYYEKSGYSQDEIKLIALEHEFYFEQVSEALNLTMLERDGKIESYLYANVRQKNRLTGAKFTSYVPVWLEQNQLHIAKGQLGSLKHELVHVLAKQFGNKILNASWSIGLVEGLAVALAGGASPRTTIHQIVAAEKPWPTARAMKNALSISGFYSESGAVSYTVTGSFVKYLLHNYPVNYFKTAYRLADIEEAYPQPYSTLIEGWHRFLETVETDTLDQKIAARLFSIPSLLEQACPHVLSPVARHLQNYRFFLMNEDTNDALRELAAFRKIAPVDSLINRNWMFLSLKTGNVSDVLSLRNDRLKTWEAELLLADALALKGRWEAAAQRLEKVSARLDSLSYQMKQQLNIRGNKKHWKYYLNTVYHNKFFSLPVYRYLKSQLQLLLINKTIKQERWHLFKYYASIAINNSLNIHYFDLYLKIIHHLGFLNAYGLARQWIEKTMDLDLRKRYKLRLGQEIQWLEFVDRR